MNGYNCYSLPDFIAFFYVKIMLLMGCFLLQKNILLMRWILLDLLRHIFHVKFPPNIAPTHCTTPRRHICGRVCHHGNNGAGTAICFALAQVCASGVTVAVSL